MNKAVFLDRDGVLNRTLLKNGRPYAPRTLEEFEINTDIQELHRLKKLGYKLVVVTNQPDVADKIVTREFVADLHERLHKAFPFDDIIACFHNDKDKCQCRKPLPGMFFEARARYDIDLENSYMIGDRWRDIEAGSAAGCTTIFIDHGYKDPAPKAFHPDYTCKSLTEAIEWIEAR